MPKPVWVRAERQDALGVMDMMGNVYEWTSRRELLRGQPVKVESEKIAHHVTRGASYATDQTQSLSLQHVADWFTDTLRFPGWLSSRALCPMTAKRSTLI